MQNTDNRLNTTWWALRVLFGFVPIAAGLDKFFNLLTNRGRNKCSAKKKPIARVIDWIDSIAIC